MLYFFLHSGYQYRMLITIESSDVDITDDIIPLISGLDFNVNNEYYGRSMSSYIGVL